MDLFAYIDRTEPSSPTSVTPSSVSVFVEDPSSRSFFQLKETGRTVYKNVWNEFYDWEPGYCAEILRTVTQPTLASKREAARVAKAAVTRLLDDPHDRVLERTGDRADAVVMSVTHFASGDHRDAHRRRTDILIPVTIIDTYPPHPRYESCPPVSRSVIADIAHEHTLPFLPYADDDGFPADEYLAKFDFLEWETPLDPDIEMIQIETVRRLHTMHKVDLQDIDRMEMFKKVRQEHNTGLLYEQSQRDLLHWPGAFRFPETKEQLPVYTPDPNDLRQRLMSNLRIFCPSINCLHSSCETHGPGGQVHANSYIPSRKPQLTAQDMILSEGVPCGPDCFRYIQDFERFTETLPSSPHKSHHTGSVDTLETVLGIMPDLFPCQLAIICFRPCKQVFVQRLQLFPDHTILPTILPGTTGNPLIDADADGGHNLPQQTKIKERHMYTSVLGSELLGACAHPGSCISYHCPCYAGKQHCSLTCRCGVKCERQWPSCSCTNGRCLPKTCPCAKQGRECVPGICISCDAGGHTGRPCHNTKMQCLISKPVEVKCGTHGLGAFACQNMSKGAFLGAYVGYILGAQLADSMSELAKHTSLNYMFELASDKGDVQSPVLDAAHLGNATRFLNHMEGDRANVEAKIMLVIGEHQIGFFTTRKVKAGEELLLDYGTNFWKDAEE